MQEQATDEGDGCISLMETAPTYQLPMPDEEKERITADPFWKQKGITPTDDMIARIYRAQQFKKLYGGSAKSDKGASGVSFPPNVPVSE